MQPEQSIVPRDKFDLAVASAAAHAGWPEIERVTDELLTWVQDSNWPVAGVLAPMLASVGAPLAPYVRRVLAGEDETWKYHLIQSVVASSQELSFALRAELELIAFMPTASERSEEIAAVALEALEQL